ncbi:MAG: Gfo/Idh/MocA family protein [Haloarculaceae archaeon]
MEIALIGSSGHTGYVTDEIDRSDVTVVGVAPGSSGEDVSDLYESVGEQCPSATRYDSAGELLDGAEPDLVAVSCQFGDLASVSRAALERDVHVFTEKPPATTLDDLDRLRTAYADADAELAGMFGIRYDPWFYTAYERVESGAVGEVRLVDARKSYRLGSRAEFYRSRETYGGTIPWVGIHAVDWVNWVTDSAFESVFARHSARQNRGHGDLETSAVATFELDGETLATVTADYYRPETAPTHGDDRLRVVGTEGVVEVRNGEVLLIDDGAEGERRLPQEDPGGIFADFLSSLEGDGPCMVSAEESFKATEVSLKARQAADEGTTVTL